MSTFTRFDHHSYILIFMNNSCGFIDSSYDCCAVDFSYIWSVYTSIYVNGNVGIYKYIYQIWWHTYIQYTVYSSGIKR